jgi:hypothetical protein
VLRGTSGKVAPSGDLARFRLAAARTRLAAPVKISAPLPWKRALRLADTADFKINEIDSY